VTERPWRCFVAVQIDDHLRRGLTRAVHAWRRRPDCADLRWTDADGWHLTLAFLGSTDPGRVAVIAAALERAAGSQPPFAVHAGGVGAFPSRARARVAWYGFADPDRRLAGLAVSVREALGIEPEARPFRPHVTLARARADAAIDLRAWVASGAAEAPSAELRVDAIRLMRSHLGRGPARYEELAAMPLGVEASVRG
jgi:2'-5' RNA ligase